SVAFLPRKRSNRFKLVFAAVLLTMQTASYLSLPRVVAQAQRDAAAHPHDRRAQERLADFNDEFGVPSQPALAKDIKIH
ncbi:hypothetical protein ABTK64_20670, partial [Acinetobacter baumannii]